MVWTVDGIFPGFDVQAHFFHESSHRVVTDYEAFLAQRGTEALVVLQQGAGDAETDGAGLTAGTAAADIDIDVELVGQIDGFQRLAHDHARGLATEVIVDGLLVDGDVAVA